LAADVALNQTSCDHTRQLNAALTSSNDNLKNDCCHHKHWRHAALCHAMRCLLLLLPQLEQQ
jgi:hypothetical protein